MRQTLIRIWEHGLEKKSRNSRYRESYRAKLIKTGAGYRSFLHSNFDREASGISLKTIPRKNGVYDPWSPRFGLSWTTDWSQREKHPNDSRLLSWSPDWLSTTRKEVLEASNLVTGTCYMMSTFNLITKKPRLPKSAKKFHMHWKR